MAEDSAAKEAVIAQFAEDLVARDPFLAAVKQLDVSVSAVRDTAAALDATYRDHQPGAYARLRHLEGADTLQELTVEITRSLHLIRSFARRF